MTALMKNDSQENVRISKKILQKPHICPAHPSGNSIIQSINLKRFRISCFKNPFRYRSFTNVSFSLKILFQTIFFGNSGTSRDALSFCLPDPAIML